MASSTSRRGWSASAWIVVITLLLQGAYAVQPAHAASISVSVAQWTHDPATNEVEWDVSIGGAAGTECQTANCSWSVQLGELVDHEVVVHGSLLAGTFRNADDQWSFSGSGNGTVTSSMPTTHVRARLHAGGIYYTSGWQQVASYPAATINLDVNTWDANYATGVHDVDVSVSAEGLRGPGQVCYNAGATSQCTMRIEAGELVDGDIVTRHTFVTSPAGTLWTRNLSFTDNSFAFSYPLTHVRARITRTGRPDLATGWQQVATYPPATINLDVNTWDANYATGVHDVDVSVSAEGLRGPGQVCYNAGATSQCTMRIEAGELVDGNIVSRVTLHSSASSIWTRSATYANANLTSSYPLTHVRARITRTGRPELTTGWQQVATYPPATINLDVNTWDANLATNTHDVDLHVTAEGLRGPGQICYGTTAVNSCTIRIDVGELVEGEIVHRLTPASGPVNSTAWTRVISYTDDNLASTDPLTHVRARVTRSGRPDLTTGWQQVATYPPATISLDVRTWDTHPTTDVHDVDLHVTAEGLRGPGQVCYNASAVNPCTIRIDAGELVNGEIIHRQTLSTGPINSASWTRIFAYANANLTSTHTLTHVRARVTRNTRPDLTTGWQQVRLSERDIDIRAEAYTGLFVYSGVNLLDVCGELLFVQGTHHQGSSTSDQYNACSAAAMAGQPAKSVVRAVVETARGNPQVLQRIVDTVVAVLVITAIDDDGPTVLWPPPPPVIDPDPDDPDPEPEPEPEVAGAAGMIPPIDPGCLSPAERQALLDESPIQKHHIVSRFANEGLLDAFQDVLDSNNLGHLSIQRGDWNLIRIPHLGRHPTDYHDWVMENLVVAATWADTQATILEPVDVEQRDELRETLFLRAWQYVRSTIQQDPTIVRKAWWNC